MKVALYRNVFKFLVKQSAETVARSCRLTAHAVECLWRRRILYSVFDATTQYHVDRPISVSF